MFFLPSNLTLSIVLCILYMVLYAGSSVPSNNQFFDLKPSGLTLPTYNEHECSAQNAGLGLGELVRLSTLQKNPNWIFPSTYTDTQTCSGIIISYLPFREKLTYIHPFHWNPSSTLNFTASIQNMLKTLETYFEPFYVMGTCGENNRPFCFRLTLFDDTQP
ncbi:hypothetical protein HMI54_009891, partial [Coelomomyces lativittatus]